MQPQEVMELNNCGGNNICSLLLSAGYDSGPLLTAFCSPPISSSQQPVTLLLLYQPHFTARRPRGSLIISNSGPYSGPRPERPHCCRAFFFIFLSRWQGPTSLHVGCFTPEKTLTVDTPAACFFEAEADLQLPDSTNTTAT